MLDAFANPLPSIAEARHVRNHVLWVRFANGAAGEVDLAEALAARRGPVLAPLSDPAFFAQFENRRGYLEWPNGADWGADALYDRLLASDCALAQRIGDEQRRASDIVARMPEISRFLGIVIRMLADDHNRPHFHALYGEFEVSVAIRERHVVGKFPARALRLVLEWAELHEEELMLNWERLRRGESVVSIPPLE